MGLLTSYHNYSNIDECGILEYETSKNCWRIEKYKIEKIELEKQCESIEPLEVRIENVKKKIRRLLDISYNGVDEKIIEEFVDKIIVHKDYFEWKFNFMNEPIKLVISGKSKADCLLKEI